jgi:hypothetical protein
LICAADHVRTVAAAGDKHGVPHLRRGRHILCKTEMAGWTTAS